MIKVISRKFVAEIPSLAVIASNSFIDHVINHNLGTDKIQVLTNSNIVSTGLGADIYADFYSEGGTPSTSNRGLIIISPTSNQVTLRFYRWHGSIVSVRVVVKTTE